jgi:hypothetical protein
MHSLGATLLSLVFVAIGAMIIRYALGMAKKCTQSLSWPSIEGEIAHSAVLYQTNTANSDQEGPTFKADVAYRYKIKGANYSSSKVSLLDIATSSTGRAQSIVQRYPDKSKVRVYYNPSNPSEAVLEPGAASGLGILYGVGGLFAAFGLIFLVLSLTGQVHS